ncbi:hypothetical protein [Lyngbya confervoides]|uniref:EAL domain-containing protein n=1 Tax=Lyngbya confervoides BDU141951 TaxID=1574623 RepID=A0ABD4T9A9_9CYAN|nr:hypothetical protein [Lyngbya confervoides]MCM1984912.1 hypothetical protein [Lyngbya confervoides BDU141951]
MLHLGIICLKKGSLVRAKQIKIVSCLEGDHILTSMCDYPSSFKKYNVGQTVIVDIDHSLSIKYIEAASKHALSIISRNADTTTFQNIKKNDFQRIDLEESRVLLDRSKQNQSNIINYNAIRRMRISQGLNRVNINKLPDQYNENELGPYEISLPHASVDGLQLQEHKLPTLKYESILDVDTKNIVGVHACCYNKLFPVDRNRDHPKAQLDLKNHKFILVRKVIEKLNSWHRLGYAPLYITLDLSFINPDILDIDFFKTIRSYQNVNNLRLKYFDVQLLSNFDMQRKYHGVDTSIYDVAFNLELEILRFNEDNFLEILENRCIKIISLNVKRFNCFTNNSDNKITNNLKNIIQLTRLYNIDFLCTGIEHLQELKLLQSLGCNLFRGTLIDPPLSESEMSDVLAANWFARRRDLKKQS